MSDDSVSFRSNLGKVQNELSKSFSKLSSGLRITKASDDPAGLQIAKQLDAEAAKLSVGSRNASYAQSALDVTGSAISQITDIAGRLGELATQASNGTLSDTQRSALNDEYQQLSQEIDRIAGTTQFNGKSLLDGSSLSTQVGTSGDANSQINVNGVDASSISSGARSQDISTQAGAQAALTAVNSLVSNISEAQGSLGAISSRLESASANDDVQRENALAASSRIQDVDYAAEIANKVSGEIRLQSTVALNASANQSAQVVLNLLK